MRYYPFINKRKKTLSDWPFLLATISVSLLCWIAGYFYSMGFPLTVDDVIVPFVSRLWEWLTNRLFVYVTGLLLVVLIAFILNRINDIEMLIRERTRLVFMFFVLLISTNAGILPFSEKTIILLCFVFMIHEIFNTYQLPEATGKLFNVGVLIGLTGLFMPQALWYIPLVWIGMYQFYSLSLRSFLASLIGILIIYWFVLAWCVWTHDFSMFVSFFSSLMDFELFFIFRSFRYDHISFVMIVILLFLSFFYIKMDAINNRVRVRQMLSFLINMSIGSLVLIFLYGRDIDSFLAIFYLPVSVLLAYFFENMRYRFKFFLYYLVLTVCAFSFILRIWSY